jgi:hypothetical protein
MGPDQAQRLSVGFPTELLSVVGLPIRRLCGKWRIEIGLHKAQLAARFPAIVCAQILALELDQPLSKPGGQTVLNRFIFSAKSLFRNRGASP